jgi:hypothetical protein
MLPKRAILLQWRVAHRVVLAVAVRLLTAAQIMDT